MTLSVGQKNSQKRTPLSKPAQGLCNITFVILICFHLTIFFGEEKFCLLPSNENPLLTSFFSVSSTTMFLEGNALNFSSPEIFVKWKHVKITNMIIQRLQVLCSSAWTLDKSVTVGNLILEVQLKKNIKYKKYAIIDYIDEF